MGLTSKRPSPLAALPVALVSPSALVTLDEKHNKRMLETTYDISY